MMKSLTVTLFVLLLAPLSAHAGINAYMNSLGKEYGLFFVFASYCPYCHEEAPMLKAFSMHYGISVIGISKDGHGLPDFPKPRPDTGISAQLHVHTIPALFLVNPRQRIVIPLAYGLISERELIRRIITLTRRALPQRQVSRRSGYGGSQ